MSSTQGSFNPQALEVRVGNVETEAGVWQVFGAVAKADTGLEALICRTLLCRTPDL